MKKISVLLLALLMVFTFAACKNDTPQPEENTYDSLATFTGSWIKDRTDPKAFDIEAGIISITNDTTNDSEGFWRYQGKKSFLDMTTAVKAWEMTTELILTEEDLTNESIITSIWLDVSTTTDTQGVVDWTIIEFAGDENGGHFNWWDATNNGSWNIIENSAPVAGSNKIKMIFDNGTFKLYVNDIEVATYEKSDGDGEVFKTSLIRSVLLQVSNEKATEYTARWGVPHIRYSSK